MLTMLDASGLRTACRAEAFRTGALRTAERALGIGIENDNTTQLGTVSTCVASSSTALANGTCTASDKPSPAKLAGLRPAIR